MKGHRLQIADRGEVHRHRFTPSCSCGEWVGRHRQTVDAAAELWRIAHFAPLERLNSGRGRSRRPARPLQPRPVTPADDLPPELRMAVR